MNSENMAWKKSGAAKAAAMNQRLRAFIAFVEDHVWF